MVLKLLDDLIGVASNLNNTSIRSSKHNPEIIPFIIKISSDKTTLFNGLLSTKTKGLPYVYDYQNLEIKNDIINGRLSSSSNRANYLIDFTNRLHEENGKVHRF